MTNIIAYLQKSFVSFESSIILPLNKIGYYLVKCAKSNSYVETLGKHADSLHIWIKKSYEEDFKKSIELQVRKALRHLGVSFAWIAIDVTSEPFYGKTRSLYVFNTKDKKHDGEFRFITVCVIIRNKPIPLMALPVRVGEGFASPAIKLLKYCQTLFKSIRLATFDRSFYVAELIDYLEAKDVRYIIHVPEIKGIITGYVQEYFGFWDQILEERLYYFEVFYQAGIHNLNSSLLRKQIQFFL